MGREWSWVGRSTQTKKPAAAAVEETTSSGCMSGVFHLFDFHQFQFPLHQPCFKTPNSFLEEEEPTILKGVEAPRNSLESEEGPCMESVPLSSIMKQGDLNLVDDARRRRRAETKGLMKENLSLETSISPATKTPNLVARLMGLDLMPDGFSPSFSCSSSSISSSVYKDPHLRVKPNQDNHLEGAAVKRDARSRRTLHCRSNSNINFKEGEMRYEAFTGSRSLPDTPRISAARRSADSDPRLSLQINKENLMILPDEILSRNSFTYSSYSTKSRKKEWRNGDENRSPSHYARQIVKQVKDSVGRRKMGLDITNTNRNGAHEVDSPTIRSQKTRSLANVGDESIPSKQSTPSCSPRLRFLEPKNKSATATPTNNEQSSHSLRPKHLQVSSLRPTPAPSQPQSSLSSSTSQSADNQPQVKAPRKAKQRIAKCQKGSSSERFNQKISETVRNKREEAFVRAIPATKANLSDKKCKKTPLSNDLVSIAVPSVVLLKKEHQVSSTIQKPVAQGSKRSSQLSCCLSLNKKQQEATEVLAHQDDSKGKSSSRNGGAVEFRYVKGILRSTGIFRDSSISNTRWFSPRKPLNPLIFHYLERSFTSSKTEDQEEFLNDEDDHEGEIDDLGPLKHRCNRKLMFQLVNEILVEELKPYLNKKPWLCCIDRGVLSRPKNNKMTALQLLDRLWFRIQSFPSAHCQILQDIDALVEMDQPETNMRTALPYSEEGESIVFQIEHFILDSLLQETAAAIVE